MANHNEPTNTTNYANVLSIIDERLDDIAKGLDPVTATNMSNLPLYAVRWSSADNKWYKQTTLGNWAELSTLYAINISGNANTVTNGVYTAGNQTIAGTKTFSDSVVLLNGTAEMRVTMGSGAGYLYGTSSSVGFGKGSYSAALDITTGDFTTSGNLTAFSDKRLKTDLVKIDSALNKVAQLTGYVYTRTDTNQRQVGLLAQDVQEVLPEAVIENDKKFLSLAYGNLVALLVEAIKELKQEVNELKASK